MPSAPPGATDRPATGRKTIIREHHSATDPDALALHALGWILTDDDRAQRLLALTGLTPEDLRERLTERATLAATLDFLVGHEPDLLLAADALSVEPAALVAAHRELSA